jgi:hypothetical protein
MRHFVWLAYLDWCNQPNSENHYRWERLDNRLKQLVGAGPRG